MSDTATRTTSSVVWFELPADDSARARSFYGSLLGWRFQAFGDDDYHVSPEAGGAIHAGQRGLLAYFGVDDRHGSRTRPRARRRGAGETQEIAGVGRFAICTDTEGNAFGLYEDAA